MSRPFSYNDENFTVIDNILFVHINIGKKDYVSGATIATIPPAILDRLFTKNNFANVSNTAENANASQIPIRIIGREIKVYSGISATLYMPRLLLSWFLLKDI